MRTYKQLKEDYEILKEVNERHAEVLQNISKVLKTRNEDIAKLKIENRYLNRKISELEDYLDNHKELIARKYNRDVQC